MRAPYYWAPWWLDLGAAGRRFATRLGYQRPFPREGRTPPRALSNEMEPQGPGPGLFLYDLRDGNGPVLSCDLDITPTGWWDLLRDPQEKGPPTFRIGGQR